MKRKNTFKNIICLFSFIFVVVLLAACSSADESDWANSGVADAPTTNMEWDEEDTAFSLDLFEEDESVESEEGVLGSIPILLPSESGRQLAYTVDFNLQTTELMSGMRLLLDEVAGMGGYSEIVIVNGRCLRQPYLERNAYFVFRIPNEQLSDFLVFIEDNYNLVRLDKRLMDFTFAYERNVDNLEALREQEQRILDELDSDESDNDDIKQDNLADIRSQIRDLEESNIEIQRDVDYSDVTLRLSEVITPEEEPEEEPATFGERLQDALGTAADHFLIALQFIVLITVAILPWGLTTALIVVPIVYVIKKRRKKKGKDELLGG